MGDRIDEPLGPFTTIFIVLCIAVAVAVAIFMIAALWRVNTKAGKPGWAAIIPFYNVIVLLEIIGRPLWWLFLLLIPVINIVFSFIVHIDLAKSFGKGTGFGVGLTLLSLIFFPILGFGSARYLGPVAGNQPRGFSGPLDTGV